MMDVKGDGVGLISSIKEHPVTTSVLNRLPSVNAETLAPPLAIAKKVSDSLPQIRGDRLPAIKALAATNLKQPIASITQVVGASSVRVNAFRFFVHECL
jgi:hypothetical protein